MDKKEQLSSIIKANTEMKEYFGKIAEAADAELQNIRQELFEIDIRLEEQGKTRSLYAMNTNSRKNVFSPIRPDAQNLERESLVEEKIRQLTEKKKELSDRRSTQEKILSDAESKLKLLRTALHSAAKLSRDPYFVDDDAEEDTFVFIEEPEPVSEIDGHGEKILNLIAFDRSYLTTILNKRVTIPLLNQQRYLNNLKSLIFTDPQQAKMTVGELLSRNDQILSSLQDQTEQLQPDFDERRPISQTLDEWVMDIRDLHPEYVLDSSIHISEDSLTLPYIQGLSMIRILDLSMDNIFRHSGANHLRLRININENQVDVFLNDNGVGIPEDYASTSPWYSSLHKAEEIVFLLGGHIEINGSRSSGTTIRFTLPLKAESKEENK